MPAKQPPNKSVYYLWLIFALLPHKGHVVKPIYLDTWLYGYHTINEMCIFRLGYILQMHILYTMLLMISIIPAALRAPFALYFVFNIFIFLNIIYNIVSRLSGMSGRFLFECKCVMCVVLKELQVWEMWNVTELRKFFCLAFFFSSKLIELHQTSVKLTRPN